MSRNLLKAYEDIEFLKRDECRPVRLQLELLKPELIIAEHNIDSTIVLFGSARIPSPEKAEAGLEAALARLAQEPECSESRRAVEVARHMVDLSSWYGVAREFSSLVSGCCQIRGRCSYVIMTGGGGGIMEAGNRGAADVGAKSIGLNISLPFEQAANPYIPDDLVFYFHYFSIRKMHFLMRAKALCAFPGGFGTLDELFETLTLIQTRKLDPIPVILFGREFWEDAINWGKFGEYGLISPGDLEIFHYCETAQEGWNYIQDFWGETG